MPFRSAIPSGVDSQNSPGISTWGFVTTDGSPVARGHLSLKGPLKDRPRASARRNSGQRNSRLVSAAMSRTAEERHDLRQMDTVEGHTLRTCQAAQVFFSTTIAAASTGIFEFALLLEARRRREKGMPAGPPNVTAWSISPGRKRASPGWRVPRHAAPADTPRGRCPKLVARTGGGGGRL